ncbi:MAG: iron response transcriptional regulator IrrA [Geminicoccaceae bacterium]
MNRRALDRLQTHGIKPTKQRLALSRLLFEGEHRHVTADQIFDEAISEGVGISLATVYNTLHQFARAGLLREVAVDLGQSYFDTNISRHHHFFDADNGRLVDIPEDEIGIAKLPIPPDGQQIVSVEVVVRLRRKGT